MNLPMLYAAGMGLAYIGVGLYCFFAPDGLMAMWGAHIQTTAERIDIQATYGGLDLGVGLFVLWSLFIRGDTEGAVVAAALAVAGFALARGLAMAWAGEAGVHLGFFVFELVCALLGFVAWRSLQGAA